MSPDDEPDSSDCEGSQHSSIDSNPAPFDQATADKKAQYVSRRRERHSDSPVPAGPHSNSHHRHFSAGRRNFSNKSSGKGEPVVLNAISDDSDEDTFYEDEDMGQGMGMGHNSTDRLNSNSRTEQKRMSTSSHVETHHVKASYTQMYYPTLSSPPTPTRIPCDSLANGQGEIWRDWESGGANSDQDDEGGSFCSNGGKQQKEEREEWEEMEEREEWEEREEGEEEDEDERAFLERRDSEVRQLI